MEKQKLDDGDAGISKNFHSMLVNMKADINDCKNPEGELNEVQQYQLKNINKIIMIENSLYFKLCNIISDEIDNVFKAYFPVGFLFYIGYMLTELGNDFLSWIIVIFAFNFLIIVFIGVKALKDKMREDDLGCC